MLHIPRNGYLILAFQKQLNRPLSVRDARADVLLVSPRRNQYPLLLLVTLDVGANSLDKLRWCRNRVRQLSIL